MLHLCRVNKRFRLRNKQLKFLRNRENVGQLFGDYSFFQRQHSTQSVLTGIASNKNTVFALLQ